VVAIAAATVFVVVAERAGLGRPDARGRSARR